MGDGPWSKYQDEAPKKPWEKYGSSLASPSVTAPVEAPVDRDPLLPPRADAPWSEADLAAVHKPGDPRDSSGFDPMNDWGDWLQDVDASGSVGFRRGVANLLGTPVEIANLLPTIGNIWPGEQGFEPFSPRPALGAEDFYQMLSLGIPRTDAQLLPDYEPQTRGGRFAKRIGEEVGATAVPVAGLGAAAARTGVQGARELGPVARSFVEPMAVNPQKIAGREMSYAVAAGSGAQGANELVDQNGEGAWWSDLLGSIGGMTALGAGNALTGLGKNVFAATTGRTGAFDDVAGRAVVDKLIDNSSQMQGAYAAGGKEAVDASTLADQLARRSGAEAAIPGFRANIGDRVQDPGLSTLAYNVDTALPGAANARRTGNARAVDERMLSLQPEGNPAALREALAFGADKRIGDATAARDAAGLSLGDDMAAVAPGTSPVDRGVAIRGGLEDAKTAAMKLVADLYGKVEAGAPVDMAGLREAFGSVTDGLPMNDRTRFAPSQEIGTLAALAPDGESALRPLSEALSVRSGLSSDMRAPTATPQQRHVTGVYMDALDDWLGKVGGDQPAIAEANAARLDAGRRFEDVGAVPEILKTTGRDQFSMPPEAVPGRVTRNETDYRAVLAEAGSNPAARTAIADQLLDDAGKANALRSPEALSKFIADRGVMFSDFPEARAALEKAGVSKQALAAAERAAKETTAKFSPGGASPTGQYLRYDDTQTRAAIGTAWKSAQPEKAVRELLEVAGDTPETRAAAKAALWSEVTETGKLSAPTMTSADGVTRWSGRKMNELFNDPRFAKVAEILWEDNPEHLADVKGVAAALAKADGSMNAKSPASSGTAQSLSGKFDPALSTSSIASRVRSVHRGQLSPTIAVVDVLSTALRNRSAKVQSRAIDELMARAVNDPDLAAELLRKYNPADEAAESRAFLTRFGVRLPTVANILGGEGEDE